MASKATQVRESVACQTPGRVPTNLTNVVSNGSGRYDISKYLRDIMEPEHGIGLANADASDTAYTRYVAPLAMERAMICLTAYVDPTAAVTLLTARFTAAMERERVHGHIPLNRADISMLSSALEDISTEEARINKARITGQICLTALAGTSFAATADQDAMDDRVLAIEDKLKGTAHSGAMYSAQSDIFAFTPETLGYKPNRIVPINGGAAIESMSKTKPSIFNRAAKKVAAGAAKAISALADCDLLKPLSSAKRITNGLMDSNAVQSEYPKLSLQDENGQPLTEFARYVPNEPFSSKSEISSAFDMAKSFAGQLWTAMSTTTDDNGDVHEVRHDVANCTFRGANHTDKTTYTLGGQTVTLAELKQKQTDLSRLWHTVRNAAGVTGHVASIAGQALSTFGPLIEASYGINTKNVSEFLIKGPGALKSISVSATRLGDVDDAHIETATQQMLTSVLPAAADAITNMPAYFVDPTYEIVDTMSTYVNSQRSAFRDAADAVTSVNPNVAARRSKNVTSR